MIILLHYTVVLSFHIVLILLSLRLSRSSWGGIEWSGVLGQRCGMHSSVALSTQRSSPLHCQPSALRMSTSKIKQNSDVTTLEPENPSKAHEPANPHDNGAAIQTPAPVEWATALAWPKYSEV